ncbi:MAG: hypothetical protein PHE84_09165 [bacterium]|nr:hypothetical protein [bacterium]
MRTDRHSTVSLGDLVVAVYDEAARYSVDPREVSWLAAQAIDEIMRHAGRASAIQLPQTAWSGKAVELQAPRR